MSFPERVKKSLAEDLSVKNLLVAVLFLLAVFLLKETWSVIGGIFRMIWNAVCPFFWGFVLAYILHKPLDWLEGHGIPRPAAVCVIYLLLCVLVAGLMWSLVPMLAGRISDFVNTMISSVKWIRDSLAASYSGPGGETIAGVIDSSLEALTDVKGLIPTMTAALPEMLSQAFSTLMIIIVSAVLSIFMCLSWGKIRYQFHVTSMRVSKRFHDCVFAIDEDLSDYLVSMIILMAIRFAEYCLVYLIAGHPDWLILGLATSVSIIIPYIGPTAVNTIGILSALQLPAFNVILLIILIVVLAQVDNYVITPMVHSHNLNLSPLWTLFSIYAASSLFGMMGLITAVPLYLIIRTVFRMYWQTDPGPGETPTKENTDA